MSAVMPTYARYPLTLVRGEGTYVFDAEGRRYLDFISGIAVNSLGHAHPALAAAVCEQAQRLIHCSNLFHTQQQEALAERLCGLSGLGAAFFCNSGAEANEAAIKLARKYWHDRESPRRLILCAKQSFHGRTLSTLAATGQDKVKIGFDPLPPGFTHVPFGDIDALADTIDANTAAVLLEPVQGEGGVVLPPVGYLQAVRQLCDETGVLLMLDEVQTGIGRSGKWFAFEHAGIAPDILTLAKGLGGGMPIGAMLAHSSVAASFTPGSHASTFGGNPLSCTAALTVLSVIEQEGLLANAAKQGERLLTGLREIRRRHGIIHDVRGLGLLIGAQLAVDAAPLIAASRERGLLVLGAGPRVLRLLPPLNVTAGEIDEALTILDDCLTQHRTAA